MYYILKNKNIFLTDCIFNFKYLQDGKWKEILSRRKLHTSSSQKIFSENLNLRLLHPAFSQLSPAERFYRKAIMKSSGTVMEMGLTYGNLQQQQLHSSKFTISFESWERCFLFPFFTPGESFWSSFQKTQDQRLETFSQKLSKCHCPEMYCCNGLQSHLNIIPSETCSWIFADRHQHLLCCIIVCSFIEPTSTSSPPWCLHPSPSHRHSACLPLAIHTQFF